MTRVMYWNIQNFSINKISDASDEMRGASISRTNMSLVRQWLILDMIAAANPDIFVLIEVSTAYDGNGQLVRAGGGLGSLLLHELMEQRFEESWALVPPIQTGPNEAVAVFYRSRHRYFTGPHVWAGHHSAPPGTARGQYPEPYRTLPRRDIPRSAQYNARWGENSCAACTAFTYAEDHIAGGNPIPYAVRSPYMTTFTETDDNDALHRNLTVFAVHSPANGTAGAYLSQLQHVGEIVDPAGPPPPPEVRVLVGDFNVNLFNRSGRGEGTVRASYGRLIARNYELALRPPTATALNAIQRGYFNTHLRRQWSSGGPWSTVTHGPTYYPGYGYAGSQRRGQATAAQSESAIDNIFTRYEGSAVRPANSNITVLNPVTGSPYLPHAAGVPLGTVALDRSVTIPPSPLPHQGAPYGVPTRITWHSWEHFGQIRLTSDHLPLVMDV